MTLNRKQIITVAFLLVIVFALPVAIFLTKKRLDIRPRALQGKANFLLSTDSISSTVGKNIDVLVSLQLTDATLKVSGVDFLLLYDKNKLDVGNIVPNVTAVDSAAPFTEAPIVTSGGSFDDNFNFIRVAEVARRADANLPTGTFQLAKITFRGRGEGQATIKFPDDNKYLEISGTGTYVGPTVTPTPTGPTPTPILSPTLTSVLTPTSGVECTPNVSCGNWSACSAAACAGGTQTRACVDSCGKSSIQSQSCSGPGYIEICPKQENGQPQCGYCNRSYGCIGEIGPELVYCNNPPAQCCKGY